MLVILFLFCWAATVSSRNTQLVGGGSDLDRNVKLELRNYLLENYNPNHQPEHVIVSAERTVVNLGFELGHLSLDQSVLDVSGWLWITWKDQHFTWNKDNFDGLDRIYLSQEDIWHPHLELEGNADKKLNLGRAMVAVNSSGDVTWMPSGRFRSFCHVDLWLWPVDHQSCRLNFAAQDYQIDLKMETSVIGLASSLAQNSEWKLIYSGIERTEKNSHKYSHHHSPDAIEVVHNFQSGVSFSFILQRSSPTHKATLLIPAIVIIVNIISSFLLPAGDGGKISLSTISLLTICFNIIHLLHIMPDLQKPSCLLTHESLLMCHIPAIILFYGGLVVLSCLSILLHVFTTSLASSPHHKPPAVFFIFSGFLGKLLFISIPACPHPSPRLVLLDEGVEEEVAGGRGNWERDGDEMPSIQQIIRRQWLVVATGVDRILFLSYVILFSVVTTIYTFP